MCWPAAHRERRASFVYGKPGRKRGGGWGVWTVENRNGSGGGGGRAQRAQRRRPPAPPNDARQPPRQRALRRAYSGCPGAQEGRGVPAGGRRRLAAGGRPAGPPPGLPNKKRGLEALPPARAFQDASRPAAAPPPATVSTTAKKATQKPGLSVYPAPLRPPPEKRW